MSLVTGQPGPFHLPSQTLSDTVAQVPASLGIVNGTPSAPATWTLPALNTEPAIMPGAFLYVKNSSSHPITLVSAPADNIDGQSSTVVECGKTVILTVGPANTNQWLKMGVTGGAASGQSFYNMVLTDAFSYPAVVGGQPSSSPDGSLFYIRWFNAPPDVGAEIYANQNGTLALVNSLPANNAYPDPWDGYASPDFTKFTTLDSRDDADPNNLQLRVFDASFNLINSRTFSSGQAFTLYTGGNFSPDGQYMYVGWIIPGVSATFQVNILRVSDLSTVAQGVLPGFDINTPLLLQVNGALFLSYMQANGDGEGPSTTVPPYYSQVYAIDTNAGTLTLVDQSPLPRYAEKSVESYGSYAVIAHGGFCTLFPNQVNIYDDITGELTALPNDNCEARSFMFDGTKLNLVIKQSVNCCNRTTIYPPDGGLTYLVGQNTLLKEQGAYGKFIDREFVNMARLVDTPNGKMFMGDDLAIQDAAGVIPSFNAQGGWLLKVANYGGVDGDPTDDQYGIHNVLFYRIDKVPYTLSCSIAPSALCASLSAKRNPIPKGLMAKPVAKPAVKSVTPGAPKSVVPVKKETGRAAWYIQARARVVNPRPAAPTSSPTYGLSQSTGKPVPKKP